MMMHSIVMNSTMIYDLGIKFLEIVVLGLAVSLVAAVLWEKIERLRKANTEKSSSQLKRLLFILAALILIAFAGIAVLSAVRDRLPQGPTPPSGPTVPTDQVTPIAPQAVPTVTPMSKVNEIARDDFGSPASGWDTISETNGASGYDNGKYFIDLNGRVLFLTLWEDGGPEVDNAVLEIDILGPLNQPGAAQGLGFGWQKDWRGATYAFTVNSVGQCRVYETVDKGGWRTISAGELSQFAPDAPYHILRAEIRNSYLKGFVDGHLCIEAALPSYQRGFVGLVAMPNTETNQDRFLFDEFRIFEAP